MFVLYINKNSQNKVILTAIQGKIAIKSDFVEFLNVMSQFFGWEIMGQEELLTLIAPDTFCFEVLDMPFVSSLISREFEY